MEWEQRSFVSGIVLGTACGLLIGHFVFWNAAVPMAGVAALPPSFDIRIAADEVPLATAFLETSDSEVTTAHAEMTDLPGLAELSDSTDLLSEAVPMQTAQLDIRVPEPQQREPAQLVVPEASPLPSIEDGHDLPTEQQGPARAEDLKALIGRELADRPLSEQEVWFDSLKDLSLPHAAGVLEMWKQSERANSIFSSRPLAPAPIPGRVLPPAVNPDGTAKEIHLSNLKHMGLPGYLRRIPAGLEKERLALRPRIDFRFGESIETGVPHDCRIIEPGNFFFQVTDGEQSFLTRCGNFSLDEERYLVLNTSEQNLRLVPPIQIPENAITFAVLTNGNVDCALPGGETRTAGVVGLWVVPNVHGLEPAASVLLKLVSSAGVPTQINAAESEHDEYLKSGVLEASNVQPEVEFAAIKRLGDLDALQ